MENIASELVALGTLTLQVHDEHGVLKHEVHAKNLITTVGKTVIMNRLAKTTPDNGPMSYMAVGTGATAPAVGNTTLQTETGRVALTSATPSSNTSTYVATVGAGVATGTITEAGLLNANSGGDLLSRTTFTGIPKGASDTLTITWTVSIT